jgi:hypothetical protein
MRIALINSGIGLLAPAAALHRMQPGADLVLALGASNARRHR